VIDYVKIPPTLQFKPSYKVIHTLDILPLAQNLKLEKSFYQSTPSFVWDNGGPIAREFLDCLWAFGGFEESIIDVRIHKLQPGHYPCIPGYHLDWIPRKNQGKDIDLSSIPDYDHVIMILAETSLTEFVAEPIDLAVDSFKEANDIIKYVKPETWHVSNGQMVHFTSGDWHRGSPAQNSERRMLIRASNVPIKPANEIKTQSQVYIPITEASW
jgi:hypothetical protein